MNVLITGGAGFIGSHVVEAYLEAGHNVVVIDNFSTAHPIEPPQDVKLIRQDLKTCNLDKLFAEHNFDVVNHHAAQVNVRASLNDPAMDARENILVTIRLLQAATLAEKPIQRFIFASSGGAIYGVQEIYPTPEEAPEKPESPYGLAKLTAEHYIHFFKKTYKLQTVVLRYANVYGPRQDPKGEAGVVSIFADAYLKDETPTVYGDGAQTRDFVYVKDVARANVASLNDKVEGVFNIGTGIETSVNEIADKVRAISRSDIQPRHASPILGELARSAVDISSARKHLDWSPMTSLDAGLAETVSFIKEHRLTN